MLPCGPVGLSAVNFCERSLQQGLPMTGIELQQTDIRIRPATVEVSKPFLHVLFLELKQDHVCLQGEQSPKVQISGLRSYDRYTTYT